MLFNYNYHHRVIISVLFLCVCFFFLIQKQLFVLENTMPMIPGHSWHFLLNDWHIYISRSNSNRMVGFQGSSLGGWPGCFSKPVSLINTGSRSSGHVEASLSHVYRTTDPRSPTCSSWHCGSGICPQQLLTTQTYRNIHRGVRWSSVGTNIYSS